MPQQLPVPVALFPLDGTHGTKEIDGRQPDGIPYGVKLAPGPDGEQNGSYEFSGDASSRIEFPNDGGLNMNDSFTLLFWLQPAERVSDTPVAAYYNREGNNMGVTFGIMKRRLACYLSNTDDFVPPDGSDMVAGTWYYVGLSYDNVTATASLYLDGAVIATKQFSKDASYETQYPLFVGAYATDLPVYEGRIAWIQLYDVALSVEQVKAVQHFTGQSTGKNWVFYYNISCACEQYVHTIFTMSMIVERKLCCLDKLPLNRIAESDIIIIHGISFLVG